MMYVCGEQTDLEELRSRGLCNDDQLIMSDREGIGGYNPVKFASVDLGRKIIERMGDLIGAKAREMLGD